MTKLNAIRFENLNYYQSYSQFYKNSCQTIKETVLKLDFGWATPRYMKFYSWNSYIKIRGQSNFKLARSRFKRNSQFHSSGNRPAAFAEVGNSEGDLIARDNALGIFWRNISINEIDRAAYLCVVNPLNSHESRNGCHPYQKGLTISSFI